MLILPTLPSGIYYKFQSNTKKTEEIRRLKEINRIFRFGIGRFTSEEEIDYTADELIKNVNRLRDLSPLWDMLQEGIDLKSIQWGSGHSH